MQMIAQYFVVASDWTVDVLVIYLHVAATKYKYLITKFVNSEAKRAVQMRIKIFQLISTNESVNICYYYIQVMLK